MLCGEILFSGWWGSHQVSLSMRPTWLEEGWCKYSCPALWNVAGPFGFSSITRRAPRLEGAGRAIHSLFFIQAALRPRESSLPYRGAEAPSEPSSPNGVGCIQSQPVRCINEQLEQRPLALLPHALGQWVCGSGSQKPRRPE